MAKGKWITEEKKEEILLKLKPYLNAGLSIYKACIKAGIPWRTVYGIMEKDELFKQKIEAEKMYPIVLANQVVVYKINEIAKKIKEAEEKGRKPAITKDDIELVKWYLTKHRDARDEYSDRIEVETEDRELREKIDEIGKLLMSLFEDEGDKSEEKSG